jgi:hypothetical protein
MGEDQPKVENTAVTLLFGDYAIHYLELKKSSTGRFLSPAVDFNCAPKCKTVKH